MTLTSGQSTTGAPKDVVFQRMIFRRQLRLHRDAIFVFGDNVQRQGMGGQAREMRGEPNALGVVTKWDQFRDPSSYFSDDDERCAVMVMRDLGRLFNAIGEHPVIIPYDGLGTGLAELPVRAPRLYRLIFDAIDLVTHGKIPWERPK